MKVWTVWAGEYSDRVMLGVFSTKELAEEYRVWRKKIGGGYPEVDDESIEYEIDQHAAPHKVGIFVPSETYPVPGESINSDYESDKEVTVLKDNYGYQVIVNWQPDKERMIKAAHDKIAEYEAREAGL